MGGRLVKELTYEDGTPAGALWANRGEQVTVKTTSGTILIPDKVIQELCCDLYMSKEISRIESMDYDELAQRIGIAD